MRDGPSTVEMATPPHVSATTMVTTTAFTEVHYLGLRLDGHVIWIYYCGRPGGTIEVTASTTHTVTIRGFHGDPRACTRVGYRRPAIVTPVVPLPPPPRCPDWWSVVERSRCRDLFTTDPGATTTYSPRLHAVPDPHGRQSGWC